MEKILLIGENIPYLESIAEEFKKLGFSPFTAGEEDEGRRIITTEVPDVILMPQGVKRFNSLKLVFNLREVNLLSKLVYLHKEGVIPNPPDDSFYLFVADSLSPDLIVTKIVERIDEVHPLGEMSIKDVLWMLKFEGKSAILRVFTDEAEGEIIVVDGDPISCKIGVDSGDKALEALVNLESIAYEITWEVPENVERNIVNDYEHFLGKPVSEPVETGEEVKEEKSLEDLSVELDKDLKDLEITEPIEEEFSFDDFPVFEEDKKEETKEEEKFPWNFEDEELKIGKEKEETEEGEGLTLYEDKDLLEEHEVEEEKPGEKLEIEQHEEKAEKGEMDIELPEEFKLPEPEEKEEIPLKAGEESEEMVQSRIQEAVSQAESKPVEEIGKGLEKELVEKEKGEERAVYIDETLQNRLTEEIRVFPGINSAIVIKEDGVVASVPQETLEEFEPFVKLNAEEGYFISEGKTFAIASKGNLRIITCWRRGKPGFAVYGTKKILESLQD